MAESAEKFGIGLIQTSKLWKVNGIGGGEGGGEADPKMLGLLPPKLNNNHKAHTLLMALKYYFKFKLKFGYDVIDMQHKYMGHMNHQLENPKKIDVWRSSSEKTIPTIGAFTVKTAWFHLTVHAHSKLTSLKMRNNRELR